MNRPSKSRTKAIVYSCCYASEGSGLCAGAAVAKAGGLQAMCVWFAGSPPWQRLAIRWDWQLCITHQVYEQKKRLHGLNYETRKNNY